MMLLTFTFRFKVKLIPYFLRFIYRKQVLYHQLTLKNSPHFTQLLGQKRNDDFYNRGISTSFFSNAKQNKDTERLWYYCILCVTKQRKYVQISLNYLSWKIYFKEHNNYWEMENKMQFMNDWQGPLTPRRCKKVSLRLRNERSQTRQ